MGVIPMTKASPQQDDPLRRKLAEAINARTAAEQALKEMRSAIDRGFDEVAAAEAALDQAGIAVEAALKADTQRAATAIKNAVPNRNAGAIKSARAAERDAADALEIANSALKQLQQSDLAEAELAVKWAQNRLLCCISQLVVSPAKAMLADIGRLRVELAAKQAVLKLLLLAPHDGPFFPNVDNSHGQALAARLDPLAGVIAEYEALTLRRLGAAPAEQAAADAAVATWEVALAALRSGAADTELPAS